MPYVDNQYGSAKPLFDTGALLNIVSQDDKDRVHAYMLYEAMYRNSPDTFEVVLRGDEDDPSSIYIPSCRKYVDTTARFLAVDFDYAIDEDNEVDDDKKKTDLGKFLKKMFAREKIYSKSIQQKKYGLVWGDTIWHITADDTKRQGERISMHMLHPGSYFPIEEDTGTGTRVTGCHIVDLVQDPRDKDTKKKVARRQTYKKQLTEDGKGFTGFITTSLSLWEEGKWDDRNMETGDMKFVKWLVEEKPLPKEITQLPVYHIPNQPPNGSTWGLSQVAGLETIITAINQSITDEDLTITMQGMGVYVSTAGPPVDPTTGQQGTYKVGPRDVVEVSEGQDFKRVSGLSSVSPFQDHLVYLDGAGQVTLGIPDLATGVVDVSVAESGIALALKMGPIIAENSDKELEILAIWNNMLYDLLFWIKAYEKLDFLGIPLTAKTGDPMPVNREKSIQEVILLFTSGLITIEMAQDSLRPFGYDFQDGDAQKALDQQAIISGAAAFNDGEDQGTDPNADPNAAPEANTGVQVGRNGSQLALSNL